MQMQSQQRLFYSNLLTRIIRNCVFMGMVKDSIQTENGMALDYVTSKAGPNYLMGK